MLAILVLAVLAGLIGLFVWAWRRKPGREAADQFVEIWRLRPWGTQIVVDFAALELMLALWMIGDAAARGSWLLVAACIALMPILGAMPAAAYWLLR
jgi:hypothetical protein